MVDQVYEIGDRPVMGYDLLQLRQWTGLDVAELVGLLGITYNIWYDLTENKANQPIANPDLALLVWAVFSFPEENGFPQIPDPATVLAQFQEVAKDLPYPSEHGPKRLSTQRVFALLQGREPTATSRWISGGETKVVATRLKTRRLMVIFSAVLRHHGKAGLAKWLARVNAEAHWRGLSDFWKQGSWAVRKLKAKAKS